MQRSKLQFLLMALAALLRNNQVQQLMSSLGHTTNKLRSVNAHLINKVKAKVSKTLKVVLITC